MADALKDAFSPRVVRGIADDLQRIWPAFPHRRFLTLATTGLQQRELTSRAALVAEAFDATLPADYRQALEMLVSSFGPPLTVTSGFGMAVFRYLPHSQWIARHGPQHPQHLEVSFAALHALTQRFTAEFAIRPFLEQHYELTMTALSSWVDDPSVHVRRLVSEGTRSRLPWAGRLRCFQADPAPAIALLDRLVDDPERYVQRSVANHLGDIAKDHPNVALGVARRWLKQTTAGRSWIVTHGLRSLLKAGDPQALALVGHGAEPQVEVDAIAIKPRRIAKGGTSTITCTMTSTSRRPQPLRIDLRVHYRTKNDGVSAKTFRVQSVTLAARAELPMSYRLSFRDLSTRRHYPGAHRLDLVINGHVITLGTCTLTS